MLKFATNIMFILIIFVLATSLPLSTDILTLNLSQPIIENPDDSPVGVISDITIESDGDQTISDGKISFTLRSSTDQFPEDILNHFTLKLSGNKNQMSTFNLNEIAVDMKQVTANSRDYLVNLDTIMDSLPQDFYSIQIIAEEDYIPTQNTENIEFRASTYSFDFKYNGTSNSIPAGLMGMTLYYPTPDYDLLVPITRTVTTPDNRWRSLYTHLASGSKPGLGLMTGEQIIPHSPNIRISNGIANIYLYSQSLAGFEDKFSIITESIAKSMLAMGFISDVNFLVNDINTGTFGGVDLSKSYATANTLTGYLGFNSESEYAFLIPLTKAVEPGISMNDQAEMLWTILKFNDTEIAYGEEWIQLVPPQIELLDVKLEGDLLTMNFNEAFNSITNSDSIESKMLIDSLLYSFTSMPEVNRIKFTVDGNAPAKSELSTELTPAPYINLEP